MIVLHLYYKLKYIRVAWGGPEEQAAEIAAGNADAKDWQDEAKKIIETTVHHSAHLNRVTGLIILYIHHTNQMAEYYKNAPSTVTLFANSQNNPAEDASISKAPILSEFDRH